MADHLLSITPKQLEYLPDGVLLELPPTGGQSRLDDVLRRRTLPMQLVLDDTLTRAAVVARVVLPWLLAGGFADLVIVTGAHPRVLMCGATDGERADVFHRALTMLDMTPAQITTLARLARAAWATPSA